MFQVSQTEAECIYSKAEFVLLL